MIVILLVLAAVVAACWPSAHALHSLWMDVDQTTYTHGYLMAGVSLWLLWRDRSALTLSRPWLVALVPLAGVCVAWVFSVQAGIQVASMALLSPIVWLAGAAIGGRQLALRSAFPLFFIWFAVPVWGSINGILQSGTVHAVRAALRVSGVPASFQGSIVNLPAGVIEIAAGCSGLHFFIVAMAIGALLGEMRRDDWRTRLKLLLLAAALAIFTNWVRVYTIILAAHYSHMRHYLVTQSHYGYGWVLFAVAMVIYFLIERRMPLAAAASAAPATAGRTSPSLHQLLPVGLLALGLVGVTCLWQKLAARPAIAPDAEVLRSSGWVPAERASTEWLPHFAGVDAQYTGFTERAGGERIYRYAGFFLAQHQGKEFADYSTDLTGEGADLEWVAQWASPVPTTMFRRAQGEFGYLLAVSYGVAGRQFAAPLQAQLYYAAVSMLELRSPLSSIQVLRTDCTPDCATAQRAMAAEYVAPPAL